MEMNEKNGWFLPISRISRAIFCIKDKKYTLEKDF